MNKLRICVAGATGWAGSELSKGIFASDEMELVAAISRSNTVWNAAKVFRGHGWSGLRNLFCSVVVVFQPGSMV